MGELQKVVILCAIILAVVVIIVGVLIVTRPASVILPEENLQETASSTDATDTTEDDDTPMGFSITSTAFSSEGLIPTRYTCDGNQISPPLRISDVPEGTESLVLIMEDPDIPESVKTSRGIETFVHWIVFNIHPDTKAIAEGIEPDGTPGANTTGEIGYTGPCPPDREHRYFFTLYALDTMLELPPGTTKETLLTYFGDYLIDSTELIGRYERK